ncbi:Ribosomal L1 domain-containing protein 1 [Phlyctochytrium planicorne]|nr:Ribosomal L1 domain-containing protein 1 [Phlyctochytrium planicorne]
MPPCRIPVKHSLYAEDSEVCIFTKDPQQDYAKMFEEKNIEAQAISVSKLKSKYKSQQAKVELDQSYHVFFADMKVLHLLPSALGEKLFKKKFVLQIHSNMRFIIEVNSAKNSTYLQLNAGLCQAIRIGHADMTQDEIAENILYSIDTIINLVPRGWVNVTAIHLKTNESAALPLYTTEDPTNAAEEAAQPNPPPEKKTLKRKTPDTSNLLGGEETMGSLAKKDDKKRLKSKTIKSK